MRENNSTLTMYFWREEEDWDIGESREIFFFSIKRSEVLIEHY